jgi:hypothetical protein
MKCGLPDSVSDFCRTSILLLWIGCLFIDGKPWIHYSREVFRFPGGEGNPYKILWVEGKINTLGDWCEYTGEKDKVAKEHLRGKVIECYRPISAVTVTPSPDAPSL